jgi:chromate transporter
MRRLLTGRGWLTDREFLQEWTLSRISLGNHMTALAALLGQRLGGWRGVVLAVGGMLIPAGIIAVALTAGFETIRDDPAIVAALAGVAPVTIGMMLGITAVLLHSVLRVSLPGIVADAGLFVAALVAGLVVPGATILIIIVGAVIGVIFLGREELPPDAPER